MLLQVFSTRDSYDAPGGFGSVPRSHEERNPMHAALAAQAITAQVQPAPEIKAVLFTLWPRMAGGRCK